jgi:hypothetical protein
MSTTPVTPKPQQTQQQIQEIYSSWKKPTTMLDTPHNGRIIADYMMRYFPNEWSHANLDRVVTHPEVAPKLMWERNQSPSEIRATFELWWQKTIQANPTLLMTPEVNTANRMKVLTHISKFYGGRIDIPNLDACFEAVKDTLEYQKPLTAKEREAEQLRQIEELEAKDLVRRLKEAAENDENAFLERHKKATEEANKAKKDGDMNEVYRQNVDNIIAQFEIYGPTPNRINHGKTEAFRADLHKIRVEKNGVVDWKETLRVVREVIRNTDSDGSSMLNRRGL